MWSPAEGCGTAPPLRSCDHHHGNHQTVEVLSGGDQAGELIAIARSIATAKH